MGSLLGPLEKPKVGPLGMPVALKADLGKQFLTQSSPSMNNNAGYKSGYNLSNEIKRSKRPKAVLKTWKSVGYYLLKLVKGSVCAYFEHSKTDSNLGFGKPEVMLSNGKATE